MSWATYEVSEKEFKDLVEYGIPIKVPVDVLEANCGVEIRTIRGGFINAIYDANLGAIRKLNSYNPIYKEIPNRELMLYNDYLQNEKITTIVVDGFFGTGKTATVCSHLVPGLLAELEGGKGIPVAYLTKPHESLGRTYGHLPGNLAEKSKEEFTSFFQYFERFGHPFLVERLTGEDGSGCRLLNIMVFEYLRGRDIDRGWIILDEAQNTDRKEMVSFISRVGDGAKLIILGDSTATQIDKRNNDSENNGLSFAKEIFRGKKYAGIVTLQSTKHILRGQRVRDVYLALRNS